MIEQGLFDYFITHHLPRGEVLNLLPFSVSIEAFWPELLRLRKARAAEVPLKGVNGQPLWFVMTDSLMASGDRVAGMARRNIDRIEPGEEIMTEGLLDEAFFTSFVEGAPISRLECRRFLKSGEDPSSVGELLAQNNLGAIRYMAEHRYEPFSKRGLLAVAQLLTNAMNVESEDYRVTDEHRIPGRGGVCNEVPPASEIPRMMDSLFGFLNDYELHPLLKAAAAHAYLLLVRPFDEGNERLARLVSYDILLRNGYSFFRQFALSGMIAQDGILYYKAMEALQDAKSGGDMTCFLEYYLGMLSRGVNGFDAYLTKKRAAEQEKGKETESANPANTAYRLTENKKSAQHPSGSQMAIRYETDEERDKLMAKCHSPEMLISFVIRQQAANIKMFSTKPYFENLGMTESQVLCLLNKMNTDITKRALMMHSYFAGNPSRHYTCRELSDTLHLTIGTTRRTCYILATLNLIRAMPGKAHGNQREMLHFFYEEALAA